MPAPASSRSPPRARATGTSRSRDRDALSANERDVRAGGAPRQRQDAGEGAMPKSKEWVGGTKILLPTLTTESDQRSRWTTPKGRKDLCNPMSSRRALETGIIESQAETGVTRGETDYFCHLKDCRTGLIGDSPSSSSLTPVIHFGPHQSLFVCSRVQNRPA